MTIDLNAQAERSRPLLRSIRGSASRRGKTPLARLSVRAHALSSAMTIGVLPNLIAASDALRKFLADPANSTPSAAEFTQPGAVLTELLRRYQAASRQCVREWLHGPQPIVWLVEAASGQILDTLSEPIAYGTSTAGELYIALADDQPLHGLRERHTRAGIGAPRRGAMQIH